MKNIIQHIIRNNLLKLSFVLKYQWKLDKIRVNQLLCSADRILVAVHIM